MCSRGYKSLYLIDLGKTNFKQTWDLQKSLVDLRVANKIPDTLLITEHEPVITMGRGTSPKNLLVSRKELEKRGIDLFQIERGGDITYHGPGQIVAYPIVDLTARGRDLHAYLRDLEEVVIKTLKEYNINAAVKRGLTGVWSNNHKLAAIGVAVRRWVSYHGLALNVNIDLGYDELINPCGITQFPVGSVASMLKKDIDLDETRNLLVENFVDYFNYEPKKIDNVERLISELKVA